MIVEKLRSAAVNAGNKIQDKFENEEINDKRFVVDSGSKKRSLQVYDNKLIKSLKRQNKELLVLYGVIMKYAREGQYDHIPFALREFSVFLMDHLRKEDAELNFYLDCCFKRGMLQANLVESLGGYEDFRSAMKEKTIEIENLINHSPHLPVTDESVIGFMREFRMIGEILIKRIYNEENILYPLYADLDPFKIKVT